MKLIDISAWLNDCLMASGCHCGGQSSAVPPEAEGWALGLQNTFLLGDLGELGAAAAAGAFTQHRRVSDWEQPQLQLTLQ